MGPTTVSTPEPGAVGLAIATRPCEVLMPESPQIDDGRRMEPPPSDPVASGTMPAASAAADPPDDPAGVYAGFHGLRVAPNTGLSVMPLWPYSGVFVLPSTTQPAARSRATSTESRPATGSSARNAEP